MNHSWMIILGSMWRHLCGRKREVSLPVAMAWSTITEALIRQINAGGRFRGDIGSWKLHMVAALAAGKFQMNRPKKYHNHRLHRQHQLCSLRSDLMLGIPPRSSSIKHRCDELFHQDESKIKKPLRKNLIPEHRVFPILKTVINRLAANDSDHRATAITCLSSPRPDQIASLLRWLFQAPPIVNEFESEGIEQENESMATTCRLEVSSDMLNWKSAAQIVKLILDRVNHDSDCAKEMKKLMHPYLHSFIKQTMRMLSEPKLSLRWDLLSLRIHCCSIIKSCVPFFEATERDFKFRHEIFRQLSTWSGITKDGEVYFHRAQNHRKAHVEDAENQEYIAQAEKVISQQYQKLKEKATSAVTGILEGPTFDAVLQELCKPIYPSLNVVDASVTTRKSPVFTWIDKALQDNSSSVVEAGVDGLCALMKGNPGLASLFVGQCYFGSGRVARRYFQAIVHVLKDPAAQSRIIASSSKGENRVTGLSSGSNPTGSSSSSSSLSFSSSSGDAKAIAAAQPKSSANIDSQPHVELEWYRLVVLIMFKVSDVEKWVRSLALSLLAAKEIELAKVLSKCYSAAPNKDNQDKQEDDPNQTIVFDTAEATEATFSETTSEHDVGSSSGPPSPTDGAQRRRRSKHSLSGLLGPNSNILDGRYNQLMKISEFLADELHLTATSICLLVIEVQSCLKIAFFKEQENISPSETRRVDARVSRLLRILPPYLERLELLQDDAKDSLDKKHEYLSATPSKPTDIMSQILDVVFSVTYRFSKTHTNETANIWTAIVHCKSNVRYIVWYLLRRKELMPQGDPTSSISNDDAQDEEEQQKWLQTARRVVYLLSSEAPRETTLVLAHAIAQRFNHTKPAPAKRRGKEFQEQIIPIGILLLETLCEVVDIVPVLEASVDHIALLPIVLFCAVTSVIAESCKRVRRAARQALAHIIYHHEVRRQSGERGTLRRPSWEVVKLVGILTGSSVPTNIHSFWYAQEHYRAHSWERRRWQFSISDQKSKRVYRKGELLDMISLVVNESIANKMSLQHSIGQRRRISILPKGQSLMHCALQMVTSGYQPIGNAETAASLFAALAPCESGYHHADTLCKFARRLMKKYNNSQSQGIVVSGSIRSAIGVEVGGGVSAPIGFNRVALILDCLLALVEQIPVTTTTSGKIKQNTDATADGDGGESFVHHRSRSTLATLVSNERIMEVSYVLETIAVTCSELAHSFLPRVQRQSLNKTESETLNFFLVLLLATIERFEDAQFAHLRNSDSKKTTSSSKIPKSTKTLASNLQRLWLLCLHGLGSDEIRMNSSHLLVEISTWTTAAALGFIDSLLLKCTSSSSSSSSRSPEGSVKNEMKVLSGIREGDNASSVLSLGTVSKTEMGVSADTHRILLTSVLCIMDVIRWKSRLGTTVKLPMMKRFVEAAKRKLIFWKSFSKGSNVTQCVPVAVFDNLRILVHLIGIEITERNRRIENKHNSGTAQQLIGTALSYADLHSDAAALSASTKFIDDTTRLLSKACVELYKVGTRPQLQELWKFLLSIVQKECESRSATGASSFNIFTFPLAMLTNLVNKFPKTEFVQQIPQAHAIVQHLISTCPYYVLSNFVESLARIDSVFHTSERGRGAGRSHDDAKRMASSLPHQRTDAKRSIIQKRSEQKRSRRLTTTLEVYGDVALFKSEDLESLENASIVDPHRERAPVAKQKHELQQQQQQQLPTIADDEESFAETAASFSPATATNARPPIPSLPPPTLPPRPQKGAAASRNRVGRGDTKGKSDNLPFDSRSLSSSSSSSRRPYTRKQDRKKKDSNYLEALRSVNGGDSSSRQKKVRRKRGDPQSPQTIAAKQKIDSASNVIGFGKKTPEDKMYRQKLSRRNTKVNMPKINVPNHHQVN